MEDKYGQLRKESKRKGGGSALKVSFKQLQQISRLHRLILRDFSVSERQWSRAQALQIYGAILNTAAWMEKPEIVPSWTSYPDKELLIGDMIIYVDVACGDHETGLL